MRARTFGHVLAFATLSVAAPAWAQTFTTGTKPYVLHGKLAADQAGAKQSGWFAVSLGTVGQPDTPVRWVGVSAFNTWDDDPFVGREVLRRLLPDQPTLLLTGPSEMLARVRDAPTGNKLVLRGMLVPESRNFMLSAVQILAPDAKMPD
jgi:hypothetical protein